MKPQIPFWHTIQKPIIGLAPMDGITDPAFRAICDVIGHPDLLYTEFVSADGLVRNKKLLRTFATHKTNTPLVGQLFGKDPKAMEEAASMLIEQTGVVCIDINMGCPAKRVAQHGGGAALIKTPDIAQKLIASVNSAIQKSGKSIGLSVKTRIGYDTIITKEWISVLLEMPINAIALHGRTLKQQYSGLAHWDEIQIAADLAKKKHILLFGNGDIASLAEAKEKIENYSSDGVLIGRATLGNPWVFSETIPTFEDRINAAVLHCNYFDALTPDANPLSLRKHLGWYIKGAPNASEIRRKLIQIKTTDEARGILRNI